MVGGFLPRYSNEGTRHAAFPTAELSGAAGRRSRWAAQPPPAASLYHQQDTGSISIHNLARQAVTAAQVQTTDGKTWDLGKGVIPRNQAKEIIVPVQHCITAVHVTLKNGQRLSQNGLNACRNTEIVVQDDRVMIPQQAVPGGQQHGTPG